MKLVKEHLNEDYKYFKGKSKEEIDKSLEGLSLKQKFEKGLNNKIKWLIDKCIEEGVIDYYHLDEIFVIGIKNNLPKLVEYALSEGLNPLNIKVRGETPWRYARHNKEILDLLSKYPGVPKYDLKKYPKGYKIYKVLEFIQKNNPTYTDIKRYVYELSYGKGTYDKIKDRGYWSTPFKKGPGYFGGEQGSISKYTTLKDKHYYVNELGLDKLKELKNKFKNYHE